MINVNQITSTLAKLPDQQLQQYAAMHKNDPYIMALAVSESNRRKQTRAAAQAGQGGEQPKVADQALESMAAMQLPEDQGIARLPAGDMDFADGGIVAFAGGGSSTQIDPSVQQGRDMEAFQIVAAEMQRAQSQLQAAQKAGDMAGVERAQADVAALQREMSRFSKKGIGAAVTAALPMSSANAAPVQAKPAAAAAAASPQNTPRSAVDQIPGQDGRPVQPPEPYKAPDKSVADYLFSPFQTAYALAHNTAAIPFAGGEALIRNIAGDKDAKPDMGKYAYYPPNPVSRDQLETIANTADKLKLPPYIPQIVAGPTSRGLKALDDKARSSVNKAVAAREVANDYAAARIGPGIQPAPPYKDIPRVNEILTARDARNTARNAGDAVAASAAAQRSAQVIPRTNAAVQGVGLAGNVSAGAYERQPRGAESPVAAALNVAGPGDPGWGKDLGQQELSPAAEKLVAKAAEEVTPKKARKGFEGEDWLTLGLTMLQSKSPRFMQALGESGIAALKGRKERFKDERDAENDDIKNKYYTALASQANAAAKSYDDGTKMLPQALKAANDAYDDWAKSPEAMMMPPAQKELKRQQLVQAALQQFRISTPAGLAGATSAAIPSGVSVRRLD